MDKNLPAAEWRSINKETVRPFRLWDSVKKKDVPHRYYSEAQRAHNSALIIVRWEKVGRTIEVYDASIGKHLGTYERRLSAIAFHKA